MADKCTNPATVQPCRHCFHEARHYMGGGIWLCFRHFLAAFGLGGAR